MSWRRALYLLPLVLFAALAVYLFQGLAPGRDPQLLPSAMIDKPAPDFALPALAGGGQFGFADLRGHVALVNFFASWCVPCRAEHPVLMALSHDSAVPLYGIAYKDKPDDAAKFLAELGNPFRQVGLDQSGRTGIDFGVYGVPETYAIDRDGRIRWRHVGPLDQATIDHELKPLLQRLGVP
jgi:cytochrome c biogenesis protein CcmG/thiol:disulfide interchange protein DsbE